MVFFFNGLTAQVTITGTIGVNVPNSSQSVINIAATGTGSNQNAYTVTAGKTFYLFGIYLRDDTADVDVYKTDGTTRVLGMRGAASSNTNHIEASTPIAGYAATENVIFKVTNGKLYGFWGIEQ
jgi:hypothetical protein